MSAREELYEALRGIGCYAPRDAEALIVKARNEHAHELAEKIRSDTDHIRYGSATDYANRHADLIDPEVSHDGE